MKKQRFDAYWQVEALRFKENQWGPVEDAAELRRAIAAGGSLEQRILHRAQGVAQRQGWPAVQQQIIKALMLSLGLLSVLFVFMGFGVAVGALGQVNGHVNVIFTLLAFLAFPTLTLLFWLFSFTVTSSQQEGVGLSRIWVWISSRLVKGPDHVLLSQALLHLSQRQRLLRWVFSSIHHWLWLCALVTATLSVVVLLSTKRFIFNWETTLLEPDTFVVLVQWLGVIPSWLGFVTPSVEVIRQSDGLQTTSAAYQVQWSSWLLGCLVMYGIVPRLIALLFSLWMCRVRLGHFVIDASQAGLLEQKNRLMPQVEIIGIDADAPADKVAVKAKRLHRPTQMATTAVVGIELPPDIAWPPFVLPSQWLDMGIVDSRPQRQTLLNDLNKERVQHLVLCVDGTQTPDRGVIAWLVELASYTDFESIYLLQPSSTSMEAFESRLPAWKQRLHQAGFKAIYIDDKQLIAELD